MAYNWLYTSWNDNEYILFLIIVILFFIIIDFKLLSRKRANFSNVVKSSTTAPKSTKSPTTTVPVTTIPITTLYQAPTETNIANDLYISQEEKDKVRKAWDKWHKAWGQLDGNEESLVYSSNTAIQNDILNLDSSMFESTNKVTPVNYAQQANWATIDELGKSMTDTLGGINSNLGYVLLDEQLGTFKPNYNSYDNTQNYKTSMNPNTVSGSNVKGAGNSYQQLGTSPIFMQKDFAGVANIFAPNIYVSNPPLGDDGFGGVSLSSGDGKTYTV